MSSFPHGIEGRHPTALVGDGVSLGRDVRIGPYAVIEGEVEIGEGCRIGHHAYVAGQTRIGRNNVLHPGCVVGGAPQDRSYRGGPARLVIGDGNVVREHATIHASAREGETVVGSGCLLMAGSHVGHDCRVGDGVILANGVLLGGYVEVGDGAVLGGNASVHQWVRIGRLAMLQGLAAMSQDLPPFLTACNVNELAGLNLVGLRRAGMPEEERSEIKRLYRLLFRRGGPLSGALEEAARTASTPAGRELIGFMESGSRGICRRLRRAGGSAG